MVLQGAMGSVPNLDSVVKKSPTKKSPPPLMGYPRRPQMMNRGGYTPHHHPAMMRGGMPHPGMMRRGMPPHPGARAHLPRGGMPSGRVTSPRGGLVGPRGMQRYPGHQPGASQAYPDYYKAGVYC